MAVRAKFRCESKTLYAHETGEVVFRPVTNDGIVNSTWSKWTPNGELRMSITNPDALAYFKPGVEYHLLIETALDQSTTD